MSASTATTTTAPNPSQQTPPDLVSGPDPNHGPGPGPGPGPGKMMPSAIDTANLSHEAPAGTSPTTSQSAADAARAMSNIGAWQPRLDRRQSWDSQEYKHEMQKRIQIDPEDGDNKPESGFTERE